MQIQQVVAEAEFFGSNRRLDHLDRREVRRCLTTQCASDGHLGEAGRRRDGFVPPSDMGSTFADRLWAHLFNRIKWC